MSLITSGKTWEEPSSPDVVRMARRYEADWLRSPDRRPEPRDYLPGEPHLHGSALLSLLRTDLSLRWAARERVPVEWYRDRYPELGGEMLVALLYEEYCLREESGETPDASEYAARFPEVAASFREVLEIHGLIRHESSLASKAPGPQVSPLPEAGQTIAGFRLVEELGRGAFARVFRAEERQLADRPVALKVTRNGSREPQTLARLQHTHIVPVHSYRTDLATGFHLLCMPYLGRLTLAQILADPLIRETRTGADLIAILDRLQPPDATLSERPVDRAALGRRSYAHAIAWWGARLAEALQHAHDRGVLHRDVKPSNILVTGDGVPMLLDFNLAQDPGLDQAQAAPTSFGGTLAYMAPEHLEALADGTFDRIDSRSDLYALGVVLFECLVRGSRTFALPSQALNLTEALLRAAEARRAEVPRLRGVYPDVPAPLEAVVRRCLAPDPDDRYASALELAADLQAVADDGPLRFAREPLVSRSIRWVRRNRRGLGMAAPLLLAGTITVLALVGSQISRLRLEAEINHWINEGTHSVREDRLDLAVSHFTTAARLAENDTRLAALRARAERESRLARETKQARDQADALFVSGERLRFALLGFSDDPGTARRSVESALNTFSVPADPEWMRRKSTTLLDEPRRTRLLDEINDLLFLWVITLERERTSDPARSRQILRICDGALTFARPRGPWLAIRAHHRAQLEGAAPPPLVTIEPGSAENSARSCFQWSLICDLEDRAEESIRWLEQATRQDPSDYWTHFYLGFHHARSGHVQRALGHYQAAVALRPDSPWSRYNRALLYHAQGDWGAALDDLNKALATARGFDFLEARNQLGLVKQDLGDAEGARAAFDSVIASGAGGSLARAGRVNRAKLDIDAGAIDRARDEYDALLAEDPRDASARLGRALLALRRGQPGKAEADLTILLRDEPEGAAELFASRALARLALGLPDEAESDAANAYRRQPRPSHERLWIRTLLRLGREHDLLWLTQPDDLAVLPAGGRSLSRELRASADRLRSAETNTGIPPALLCRTRAVLLSALNDPSAEVEASRAIALVPQSADAYLVRARVRRRAGDRSGARTDVESGLALEPNDSRLLELRAVLNSEAGRPRAALVDLNRAMAHGPLSTVRATRARTLTALGEHEAALEDWSLALANDPEDPRLYLGRAWSLSRLRRWDRAISDLERAADEALDDPRLLTRVVLTYAACLPARPDRYPRWYAHARRAWDAWLPGRVR